MSWWQRIQQWWSGASGLSEAEMRLLTAVAQGHTLKSHRYLDGSKKYKLWSSTDPEKGEEIPYELVQALLDKKFITTNQKFPSATFLLTTSGKAVVAQNDQSVRGVGDVVNFEG